MDAYWHGKNGSGNIKWHIGIGNTLEQGLKNFLAHLKTREQVLFEDPEVYDWVCNGKINYFLAARVYSKLEFFEQKYTEKVNKNV